MKHLHGFYNTQSKEQLAADSACLQGMQELLSRYGSLAFQSAYFKLNEQLHPAMQSTPKPELPKIKSFAELLAEANQPK